MKKIIKLLIERKFKESKTRNKITTMAIAFTTMSLVGTSGSEKFTLLNMFGRIDIPTSGEIIVDGNKINEMNDDAHTLFRRRNIGFISQSFNLIRLLNVYENIVLPVQLDGKKLIKNMFMRF